jgi:hypothetical protein
MAVADGVTMVEQNEHPAEEQHEEEEKIKQPESEIVEQDRRTSENLPSEQGDSYIQYEGVVQLPQRSVWFLWEKEEFSHEVKVYKERRREALLEALGEVRGGQRRLSGRVISVWVYQCREAYRLAS